MRRSPYVAVLLLTLGLLACGRGPNEPASPTSTATESTPAGTHQASQAPSTVTRPGTPAASSGPQLAYLDADGTAWLVSTDWTSRVKLLTGCTGLASTKNGDV